MLRYFPIIPLALFFVSGLPAYGYIDPGAGSMAVQAILAGFLGVLLAVKIYWKKIMKIFTGLFRGGEKKEEKKQP